MKTIQVRVSDNRYRDYKDAADKEGLTISAYTRKCIDSCGPDIKKKPRQDYQINNDIPKSLIRMNKLLEDMKLDGDEKNMYLRGCIEKEMEKIWQS